MNNAAETTISGKLELLDVAARVLRLAARAFLIVLLVVVGGEVVLRAFGLQPQSLFRTGFSATVVDRWTDWAMRPNVRINEYTVTNEFGLHEDREITLRKPPGMRRIAVVGSSVVWGLGEQFPNTIPRAAEHVLAAKGCAAEVLNFGGQGYNIQNASAYFQSKIHQFEPDALVVMMDLQMIFPHWASPRPIADEQTAIRQLGWFEGMFKRWTEYSVLLSAFDNVDYARSMLVRAFRLPIKPRAEVSSPATQSVAPGYGARIEAWLKPVMNWVSTAFEPLRANNTGVAAKLRPAPALPAMVAKAPSAEEYESRRKRELGSVVAGMSAFASRMGIPLYFVTPYGPYFHVGPEELSKFSLAMLSEASKLFGGVEQGLRRETEIASTIVAETAKREGARVIDMMPLTRTATMASGDFSTDGIHFSAQGYRHVGSIVAERLHTDGLCTDRGLTPPLH